MILPSAIASQVLRRMKYPFNVANFGDAQIFQISPSQRHHLSASNIVTRKNLNVLSQLKGLQPRANLRLR